jgi:hypothetical protein
MARLFSTDQPGDMDKIQAAYEKLADGFRGDLYVTHERMLINAPP